MDKILVTGGAGFIGSHLIERLIKEGYEVKVLDNCFRGTREYLDEITENIVFIEGSVLDPKIIEESLRGVDTVFHLAAINGTRYFYEIPHKVLEVNVKGTLNILEALLNSDVQRIIYASSSEVYGYPKYFPTDESHELVIQDPKNPRFSYAGSKLIGEILSLNYAHAYGFEAVILRPHNIYGQRMGYEHVIPEFIKRLVLDEEFTIQGKGETARSFCFISDCVEGFFLAAVTKNATNQCFNIGNDEETRILDLAYMIASIAGKTIKPVSVPLPEGGTTRRQPDISKAKKVLGYEPEVSLKEGLEITYRWYEKQLKPKKR